MAELNGHWTNRDVDDFLYRIGFDFVRQLEKWLGDEGQTQAALAEALGVSEGRVSQVLNKPGNLTLRKVIEYSRALGRKVAIVAYDDGDPDNTNGPINSEIFFACWQRAGKPTDFFDLSERCVYSANNWQAKFDPLVAGTIILGYGTSGGTDRLGTGMRAVTNSSKSPRYVARESR